MQPSTNGPFLAAHDQHRYRVRLEWGHTGVRLLAADAGVVVVVDVLSFSTAVSIAVERGAAVIPWRFRDASATDHASRVGATLANPERGAPGLTLSPASLLGLRPGARLVLPSPNGATCAVLAAEAGATVVAGCLRNATAVGRFTAGRGGTVAVVAAGEAWPDGGLRPAVEDLVGAGAVISAMVGGLLPDAYGAGGLSPEAMAAVAAFRAADNDLAGTLAGSASGRELADAGYRRDVELAANLDVTDVVPVLVDGEFRGR